MLIAPSGLSIVALLLIANGAPILARNALGNRCAWPLDFGRKFIDGHDWLGPSKTFRGVLAAVIATTLAAPLLGQSYGVGALIGLLAMAGDALASFVKRRMGAASSVSAPILDQSLEALLPVWILRNHWKLSAFDIGIIVLLFAVLNIALSRVLYKLGIRRHPM